jgi:hypothetical protein
MLESARKLQYRELCAAERSIPIFSRDWWLDAVCERGRWDVVAAERHGRLVAAMPYWARERWGLRVLSQPPLTQTLDPWMRSPDGQRAADRTEQKQIARELIEALPRFDSFSQSWHYNNNDWLPDNESDFTQTTLYTYVLADLRNEAELWKGLHENIRGDIRKASTRFQLTVRRDLDVSHFLCLNAMTFARQGRKVPYSDALVYRVDTACAARGCRMILIAEDSRGRHHAGVYVVWDENSAYYLMGGADPNLRNSGATSLCLWEAIKDTAGVTQRFDFEGSMIDSIARFFRAFGAARMPYFNFRSTPSRLLRLRESVMAFAKAH